VIAAFAILIWHKGLVSRKMTSLEIFDVVTFPAKIYRKKKSHYGQALAISFHSNFKTEFFSCTTRICKVEEQPQLTHS
jgi:hypothetical protein